MFQLTWNKWAPNELKVGCKISPVWVWPRVPWWPYLCLSPLLVDFRGAQLDFSNVGRMLLKLWPIQFSPFLSLCPFSTLVSLTGPLYWAHTGFPFGAHNNETIRDPCTCFNPKQKWHGYAGWDFFGLTSCLCFYRLVRGSLTIHSLVKWV